MNEQKLIDMIDTFRERLSEEQLRFADIAAECKRLKRELEQKENSILKLEEELEGYRVPSQTETVEPNKSMGTIN